MFAYIIILAVSLSLDALAVGISYGIRRIRIPLFPKIVICFFSMAYSGASLALGSTISRFLPHAISKYAGVGILGAMGIWVIIQALLNGHENKKNPFEGDLDGSGVIDPAEALLLGFALSIDAIGVGIGSGMAGMRSLLIPAAVGVFQLVFLYSGSLIGGKFAVSTILGRKTLSLLPGLLLLSIALARAI